MGDHDEPRENTVLLVLRRRGLGRHGCVVGFATGVVMTETVVALGADFLETVTRWALVSGAADLPAALHARGRRPQPSEARATGLTRRVTPPTREP